MLASFEFVRWNACAQIRSRIILSSERVGRRSGGWVGGGGGGESEPMFTPRDKSPLLEKFSPEED